MKIEIEINRVLGESHQQGVIKDSGGEEIMRFKVRDSEIIRQDEFNLLSNNQDEEGENIFSAC